MQANTDVVIIGGGAVGVCVAHFLQERGISVTVVEKSAICSGCSYGNAGFIAPSHIVPLASPGIIAKGLKWLLSSTSPFYIKPRLNTELFSWLWKFRQSCGEAKMQASMPVLNGLCQASASLFRAFDEDLGLSFGLTHHGLLLLQKSEKVFEEEKHVAEIATEYGLDVSILDGPEVRELEPAVGPNTIGAVLYHCDSHLNPLQFVTSLYEDLVKRGIRFIQNTEVLDFEQTQGRITRLRTTSGDLSGDTFIVAAGAWSTEILRKLDINLPMQAGKGYSVTVPVNGEEPRIPMILTEARVTVTPLGGYLRFGGTMEMSGLDLSINSKRVDAILDAVPYYVPGLRPRSLGPPQIWAGLRPCSPDGLPYIGGTGIANLMVATGHAMLGVTLAPITGKLVAELLADEETSLDVSTLAVDRFS